MRLGVAIFSVCVLSLYGRAQDGSGSGLAHTQGSRWSEQSDVVLVPKYLLSDAFLPSLTVGNLDTMDFVLTDEFARKFSLSRGEIEEVNKAVGDALHEYRTLEGKRLKQTDAPPAIGKGRELEDGDEALHFRLTPFPKEALAIRTKLEEVVRGKLGEERSKFFWQGDCLGGEMTTFTGPPSTLPDAKITVTHSFVRSAKNPDQVRRYITTYNVMPGGSGGGVSGRTIHQPLDQYAPEALKPVLARWRDEAKAWQEIPGMRGLRGALRKTLWPSAANRAICSRSLSLRTLRSRVAGMIATLSLSCRKIRCED